MDMNELVLCPFDNNHKVSRKKLQYHIVKCQQTYTGSKIPCPYNASEFVEPENLQSHLATCPSVLDRLAHDFKFKDSNLRRREIQEAPFFHSDVRHEPSERWGL